MLKKIILFTAILCIAFSCSKEQGIVLPLQKGNVSFSFSNSDLVDAKAKSLVDLNPTAIFISIVNSENETVINNQKFELLTFGSSFITDAIELSEGSYEITTFNIVDEDNIVIYASPLTGSENAEFVNNPLPIAFNVTGNESNTVSPEVIFVGPETTPEQFGFTSFSFTIVEVPTEPETQDLYISINETVDGVTNENDGTFTLTIPSQDFTLDGTVFFDHIPITIPATEANEEVIVTVFFKDHESQTFTLNADQINGYTEQEPFEVYFETLQFYFDLFHYTGTLLTSRNGDSFYIIEFINNDTNTIIYEKTNLIESLPTASIVLNIPNEAYHSIRLYVNHYDDTSDPNNPQWADREIIFDSLSELEQYRAESPLRINLFY